MKFKFLSKVKRNMFGRFEGKLTLVGEDGSTPYSIEGFFNEIIELLNMESDNTDAINDYTKFILEKMHNLEIDASMPIFNKDKKIVALVVRVNDNYTMADLMNEEYGWAFE